MSPKHPDCGRRAQLAGCQDLKRLCIRRQLEEERRQTDLGLTVKEFTAGGYLGIGVGSKKMKS